MEKLSGAGEFNRRVEFFEKQYEKVNGEAVYILASLGHRFVRRDDSLGGQLSESGQLVGEQATVYRMWFDTVLASNVSQLVVRDSDGDWQVYGPTQFVGSLGRQMQFKCVRYGEN